VLVFVVRHENQYDEFRAIRRLDLAKYVEMVNNQIRQINTMTQELQLVTAYVKPVLARSEKNRV
jgi:hypothetical protein